MIKVVRILTVFALIIAFDGRAASSCSSFEQSPEMDVSSTEAAAIRDVCTATLESYSGMFVVLEDIYVPVPNEFVVDGDPSRFRLSMFPKDSVIEASEWSYGHLFIDSSEKSLRNINTGRAEVDRLDVPQGASGCGFQISLHRYSIYLEDGTYFQDATELRISESVLVVFGGEPYLVQAMADAIVRINCPAEVE